MRLTNTAYTVDALIAAGVPADVALTLRVSATAPPERPRLRVTGRKRAKQRTTDYVWGPDAMALRPELFR